MTESKFQRASSLVRAGELLLELRTGMPDAVQARLKADASETFGEALAATAQAERATKLYGQAVLPPGSPT